MRLIKSKEHYQDEIERGRISLISTLILAGLGYKISKNKMLKFIIPFLLMAVLALLAAYGMLNEGESKLSSIATSIFAFCTLTLCVVKAFWAPIGFDFLGWVEEMFGPKTRKEVLKDYLSGQLGAEGLDVVRIARRLGEYSDSVYLKATGNE